MVSAARHDDVKAALEFGADVNEVSNNLTPLDEAIHNGDVAMVDILIKAGADVNHGHSKTGKRPIHSAVTQPDLRIMELLLAAGSDVEGCRETSTPLCYAAAFGKKEAYDRLLAAGAYPLATMRGQTASELLETGFGSDLFIQQRLKMEEQRHKPDQYARHILKMMVAYPTVEEFAAHRGRNIYMYGFGNGVYTDTAVGKWARELGEILFTAGRLTECEEQFLSGDELEKAQRVRKRTAKRLERDRRQEERIAVAAQEFSLAESKTLNDAN